MWALEDLFQRGDLLRCQARAAVRNAPVGTSSATLEAAQCGVDPTIVALDKVINDAIYETVQCIASAQNRRAFP